MNTYCKEIRQRICRMASDKKKKRKTSSIGDALSLAASVIELPFEIPFYLSSYVSSVLFLAVTHYQTANSQQRVMHLKPVPTRPLRLSGRSRSNRTRMDRPTRVHRIPTATTLYRYRRSWWKRAHPPRGRNNGNRISSTFTLLSFKM